MSARPSAIVYSGEDTNVEYKEAMNGTKIKPAIVAFANDWQDDGLGTIVIGVRDDGTIVGLKQSRDAVLQVASNWQYDGSIDPRPQLTAETNVVANKLVCTVRVPTGQRRPYRFNGTCYIRVGTSTRPATFEEETELTNRLADDNPLPHSLPSRDEIIVAFVGRKRDLASLWEWIEDPLSNRISLTGPGGSGKSALAYQFGSEVVESAPKSLSMVLWISAKSRKLVGGDISSIRPDFHDLDSALTRLLRDAGWEELDPDWSLLERRDWLIEVLSAEPALIIVDDYDSLLGNSSHRDVARCIDFFQELTAKTASKLLMTSRVDTRAGQQRRVRGFTPNSAEALQFVDSRLRLLGMTEQSLSREQKNSVLKATDGIPLFVEDLLRHHRLTQRLDRTLTEWHERGGQSAREFALRLEFDSLDEVSKAVLMSCCLLETRVTVDDIQAVTGYGIQDIEMAMLELQGLFLVSPPMEADESRTFSVSTNTTVLVKQELGNRSEFRRVRDAVTSISGEIYGNRIADQYVNTAFKRAYWYVRSDRYVEAENVILATFERPGLSEHPDLYGFLGWIYKQWQPERRSGEARESFQRAASLKCRRADMYMHWAELESQEQNWSQVIDTGKEGLSVGAVNEYSKMRLGSSVAFATSQLGKRLGREVQTSRAIQTLHEADSVFRDHICDLADIPHKGWRTHGRLVCGLVQNDEALYQLTGDPKWFDRMINDLKRWESDHRGDPKLESESMRIRQTYRSLL